MKSRQLNPHPDPRLPLPSTPEGYSGHGPSPRSHISCGFSGGHKGVSLGMAWVTKPMHVMGKGSNGYRCSMDSLPVTAK